MLCRAYCKRKAIAYLYTEHMENAHIQKLIIYLYYRCTIIIF